MSHGKQFTLYSHAASSPQGGPNGWKVALFLEELGLEYETIFLDFQTGQHKAPEYVKLNPNGRIPCIIDHKNSDFTLWESGAILEYLASTYDKEGKFSASSPEDKASAHLLSPYGAKLMDSFKQLQWLFFQASGQGPYYGQAAWFKMFHAEKIPSAIERYQKEILRVLCVLESVLSKQEWLVGNKYTVADLSFIPWHNFAVGGLLDNYDCAKEHPAVDAWIKKMVARPAIKKTLADREAANKK